MPPTPPFSPLIPPAGPSSDGQIDFLPMPDAPHPRIGWAFTCRAGGFSRGPWGALGDAPTAGDAPASGRRTQADDGAADPCRAGDAPPAIQPPGLNLGTHCGDDPAAVARNRALLARTIGQPISWLDQVHGTHVHVARPPRDPETPVTATPPSADAQISTQSGVALAVMVADCLPVLLADRQGRVVGAAHAGWRGLLDGVIEATATRMQHALTSPRTGIGTRPGTSSLPRCGTPAGPAPAQDALVAWLGPCIGPSSFEVGAEVRDAFVAHDAAAAAAFVPGTRHGKWLANLPMLARQRLARLGITHIHSAGLCTYRQPERFWSYRRTPTCGRMAALVWLRN